LDDYPINRVLDLNASLRIQDDLDVCDVVAQPSADASASSFGHLSCSSKAACSQNQNRIPYLS
jgi:hypothetical protein